MRTLAYIAAYLFGLCLGAWLAGCGPVKPKETTKQEISVAGGLALVKDGHAAYSSISGKLAATPLTDIQKGYKAGLDASHNRVYAGAIGMAKPCQEALKENDRSREGFYKLLDRSSWVGGIVLTIGLALIGTGLINGKNLTAGVGIAVLGGSAFVVFLALRSAAPVLPWVFWGLGAFALIGIGWFVYDRIQARRERIARDKQLEAERRATKEMSIREDAMEAIIPDDVKPSLPQLSPSTERLVQAAKSGTASTMLSEAKAAATGAVEATKGTLSAVKDAEKSDTSTLIATGVL